MRGSRTREEWRRRTRRRDLGLVALCIIVAVGTAFLVDALVPVCV